MKSSSTSKSDAFSISPMLALLPSVSHVGALEPLTSFFYARYEKTSAMKRELEGINDSEASRRLQAEQQMLRQVLDWLEVTPAEED